MKKELVRKWPGSGQKPGIESGLFNKHEVKDAHRVVLYPKMQRRI